MKTSILAALLLGLVPAALEASDRKAVHGRTGQAEIAAPGPKALGRNFGKARGSRSDEIAIQGERANRPPYALPNECWTDDGGFRWRPCGNAGGGGGGGGGGMERGNRPADDRRSIDFFSVDSPRSTCRHW